MFKLHYRFKKLNKDSMKRIVAALIVLSFMTISCKQSDESPQTTDSSQTDTSSQTNKSEIKSKSRPGRRSGVDTTITKVKGLIAKALGPTEISLTWDTVANAKGYWIYRDNYVPAIVLVNKYADKAVKPGTTYKYEIAPVVKSVLGPKSVSVTVKTPR